MILRINSPKSTTIVSGTTTLYLNYGANDVLNVYRYYDEYDPSAAEVARILVDPQLGSLPIDIWNLLYDADGTYSGSISGSKADGVILAFENYISSLGYLESQDVECWTLMQPWDQGARVAASGSCNWIQAQSGSNWITSGTQSPGGSLGELVDVDHLDKATEDLGFNVGEYIFYSASNGFLVKLPDAAEQGEINLYTKRLRRPYIDFLIDDRVQDDRGRLYEYNPGQLRLYGATSYDATPSMILSGSSGSYAPSSIVLSKGSWSATFDMLPQSGSYGEIWTLGDVTLLSGSVTIKSPSSIYSARTVIDTSPILSISGLQRRFSALDIPMFRVRLTDRYNPDTTLLNSIVRYAINDIWENRLIFDESLYTELSYDADGYYFKLPMYSFKTNHSYELYFSIDGIRHPTTYKFTVYE